MNPETALMLFKAEYNEAIKRYPPMRSKHEGYAILLEEIDELWTCIKTEIPPNTEAIQIGAMILRFMVDLIE